MARRRSAKKEESKQINKAKSQDSEKVIRPDISRNPRFKQ